MASGDFIVNKQPTWSVSDEIWEHWCDWRVGEKKKHSPNSYKLFLWQMEQSGQTFQRKAFHKNYVPGCFSGRFAIYPRDNNVFFSCSMCKDIIKSIQPRISKIFHTQMSQKQRYSIRFQRHAKFFFLYSARCVSNRTGFSGKQSVCRFLLKS